MNEEMDIKGMYNLLTGMPLLMGISGQDLARIEEHLKFQVETISASNYPIISQGDVCSRLRSEERRVGKEC